MSQRKESNLYFNRLMGGLLLLGFASGLPGQWSLLGQPLQAWLADMKAGEVALGRLSLIALPYSFNFMWAPLIDRFGVRCFGSAGRRRDWLLLIQIVLVAFIALLGLLGPRSETDSWLPLIVIGVCIAFFSATQDVVADAYRTDSLGEHNRAAGAAVFVNGYRIAMAIGGGGTMYFADRLGWQNVYLILSLLMGIGVLGTLLSPRLDDDAQIAPATLSDAMVKPVQDFFTRHGMLGLLILAFVICFKLPDATCRVMVTPLLQKELGFTKAVIGINQFWLGMVMTILGAMLGGVLMAKLGSRRSIWLAMVLQMVSNLGFVLLASRPAHVGLLATVVSVEAICSGIATVIFIAYIMAQCNKKFSATQYALFTSLNAATGTIAGSLTGDAVKALGYQTFFVLTVSFGLPAMLIYAVILQIQKRIDRTSEQV
jgi:PAT family beta-lactamase induction signal transducer AmpG